MRSHGYHQWAWADACLALIRRCKNMHQELNQFDEGQNQFSLVYTHISMYAPLTTWRFQGIESLEVNG
jgi:hypothetical protein